MMIGKKLYNAASVYLTLRFKKSFLIASAMLTRCAYYPCEMTMMSSPATQYCRTCSKFVHAQRWIHNKNIC